MDAHVLVVESDELLRDLLTVRLHVAGFRSHPAADGAEALRWLETHSTDLVLLASMMPMMSGAETLARLRASPSLSHIPVIMMTPPLAGEDARRLKSLGATDILRKPVCGARLVRAISEAVQARRSAATPLRRLKITVMTPAVLAATAAAGTAAAATIPAPAAAPAAVSATGSAKHTASAAEARAQTDEPARSRPAPPPVPPQPEPASGAEPWSPRTSIALVHGRSWAEDVAHSAWSDTTLTLAYRPTRRSGYSLEAGHARRFGLSDTQLQVRGDWAVGTRSSVFLAGVATPQAELRERVGLRAGFAHTPRPHLEIGASTRLGEFRDGTKLVATPYVAVSTTGERVTVIAEAINLWNLSGPADHRLGFGLRVRAAPDERWRLLGGYARYPEVEAGTARTVRSLYAGASVRVAETVTLSASVANDRYEGLFTRNGVTLGMVHEWRGRR
ncbi:response regulator [Erythrobacteraceae bacterium CFH 75059]|uniref:response regulator n=1 Tax=Qipengyuania thermophila TaxID=2509361 RepID=UPI0010211B77|nr:response regulator [Qipengyuania thermophila]TCD05358.1 response regulator [Erythrobacteraceae bacterium CFH 75059]